MAITQCPDCGKDVSTMAATCPHCGYPLQQVAPAPAPPPPASVTYAPPPPPRSGTSPWTVIGWIVLAFFALFIYSCTKMAMNMADAASGSTSASPLTGAAAKLYAVKVIDSGCQDSASGAYTQIRATVENTGTETIPFAKAFFEAYAKDGRLIEAKDTYFSPTNIPPGARASADVMLSGAVHTCSFARMQGSGGAPVSI